jgi:hypothetical protein
MEAPDDGFLYPGQVLNPEKSPGNPMQMDDVGIYSFDCTYDLGKREPAGTEERLLGMGVYFDRQLTRRRPNTSNSLADF